MPTSTSQPDATLVHGGYFSQDRNGVWSNTSHNTQDNRDNAERAYNLIMKEKEKLLELRYEAEVPLLSFGAEGRVGQSKRLPDLFAARDRHRTGAAADDRPGITPVRQPAGPAAVRLRRQHADCRRV